MTQKRSDPFDCRTEEIHGLRESEVAAISDRWREFLVLSAEIRAQGGFTLVPTRRNSRRSPLP